MTDLFSNTTPDELYHNGVRYIREDLAQPKKSGAGGSTFPAFWADVPVKIGKAAAEKAWRKLSPADRTEAHSRVKAFYASWRKQHPDASPLHPSTYLNGRRWEDEGEVVPAVATAADRRQVAINNIKSGKRYLCGNITDAQARTLVAAGEVTVEECAEVGLDGRGV
jgi:hypothetical protein